MIAGMKRSLSRSGKRPMARAAIAALALVAIASGSATQARPRLTGEEQLAKLTAGRTPGKPVNCIYMPGNRQSQVIDKTAVVFGSGQTIYVNRPRSGANSLDSRDIMILLQQTSQLCSVDIVRTVDQQTRFLRSFINLGEFVPYTRDKTKVAVAR